MSRCLFASCVDEIMVVLDASNLIQGQEANFLDAVSAVACPTLTIPLKSSGPYISCIFDTLWCFLVCSREDDAVATAPCPVGVPMQRPPGCPLSHFASLSCSLTAAGRGTLTILTCPQMSWRSKGQAGQTTWPWRHRKDIPTKIPTPR